MSKYLQLEALYHYLVKLDFENVPSLLPLNEGPFNDYWLSGFIEAEGSFYIRSTNTQRKRVSFEFSLVQHESNMSIISAICDFLQTNLSRVENKKQYRVRTSSFKSVEQLIEFHPIFGTKWNDYLDFKSAYLYHRQIKNMELSYANVVKLKKNMNHHRTSFNWSHLSHLTRQISICKILS